MRRFLQIVGGLLLALVLVVVGVGVATFGGLPPILDGQDVAGVARVVKDGYVAAFVLDIGDGKVALVDAGSDPAAGALLAELTRRGLGPDAVTDILLTHGHADHTAGIKQFPAAIVHALGTEVPLVEGRASGHGPLTRWIPAKDQGIRVTDPLQDGARVTIGTRTAEVFAVPGHTAGSAGWLVDGVLFLGDSADATKEGTLLGAKYIFTDDAAQNHASLLALSERLAPRRATVKALACAHTGVLEGGDALFAFR
jgi:glyoxylase-like metal-dependent hydrolase (beta-lactamase superfamily II)